MSVRTIAGEKMHEAKLHINAAYVCLLEVLSPNTEGNEDYDRDPILSVLNKLVEVRKELSK